MEFKYSTLVDPSIYETQNLCGDIPLRLHKDWNLEEIGAFRAQDDWRNLVGPLEIYKGGLGPRFNLMATAIPECLPERLEIISYANEFAFLYDDALDNISQEKGDIENDEMLDAFREGLETGSIEAQNVGRKQIQAKLLLEMMAIDRERAITATKAWAKFVELASGRQHYVRFRTLEEYFPYRILDVGEMFWFGLMTFGMAITIPDEEMDLCRRLSRHAWIIAGLQNDLFSWEKEYGTSVENGQSHVINAIWVLMQEHSITVEEAKRLCRLKIEEHVAHYVRDAKEAQTNLNYSAELRRYLEALRYSISGNGVWSLYCPRYHPEVAFNERQLSWMKIGVGKAPANFHNGYDGATEEVLENGRTIKPTMSSKDRSFSSSLPYSKTVSDPPLTDGANGATGENGVSGASEVNGVNDASEENHRVPLNGFNDGGKLLSATRKTNNDCGKTKKLFLESIPSSLGPEVVSAPFMYLSSMPSKGVRSRAIDALNVWMKTPAESLRIIKSVISILHGASLMLDDIEDLSPLRRGQPSTHTIFGMAQTINSANYQFVEALDELRKLNSPQCLDIFIEETRGLFIGQSFDLYWTFNITCPSVNEYLEMIDKKTGGLFRLLSRLMMAISTAHVQLDLTHLSTLIGRYFQIRDDYQNLVSTDYEKQKGYCEDIDEGKYSLPLIHALQTGPQTQNTQLRNILVQRRVAGKSAPAHKQLVLQHLQRTQSLQFTAQILNVLHDEILRQITRLEERFGTTNFSLRLLIDMLRV